MQNAQPVLHPRLWIAVRKVIVSQTRVEKHSPHHKKKLFQRPHVVLMILLRVMASHGKTAIKAGLGVSLSAGKLAKAGIDADGNMRAVSAENYSKLMKSAKEEGISNDISQIEDFRQSSGYQSSDSWNMGENYFNTQFD